MSTTFSLTLINTSKRLQTTLTNVVSYIQQGDNGGANPSALYYDGSTYRNDLDTGFVGIPWPSSTSFQSAQPSASANNGLNVSDTYQDALFNASGGTAGIKTPPLYEEKCRSQYIFTLLASDNVTTYTCRVWVDQWEIVQGPVIQV